MGQDDFSPSTQSMAKNFMFKGFDPEEYAKSISAQSDGDKDLIERRENIRVFTFRWFEQTHLRSYCPTKHLAS